MGSHSAEQEKNFDLLRRLGGEAKERKIAVLDIEAREWVHPYAVGFFDGLKYFNFQGPNCIGEALRFILRDEYIGFWIYAHNGGNYDFQFLLKRLLDEKIERRYKTEVTPVGSCMFRLDVYALDNDGEKKATAKHKRVKWTFLDSAKLMPIRLNDVGVTFGIGKKVKLDVTYDELARPENRYLMERYLEQDCRLLHAAVTRLQKTIRELGGQLGPTLPATSVDLFRRRFLKQDINTNRHFASCPDFGKSPARRTCKGCGHEFIRKAYAGGRAEIFRMRFESSPGHETARLYDVKSMYPSCMLEAMPTGPGVEVLNMTEANVYKNAKRRTGIVDCTVSIPEDCYLPPLPIKKKGGKLVFPVGTFRGTWDTAELTLLQEVGGKIIEVHRSLWFEETSIFTEFVNTIYRYRDKSLPGWNAGMDWIAKIILNALYGKFAMHETRTRYVIHPDDIDGMTPISFESDIWSEDVEVTAAYIVPQLAVHITALARRRLWTILNGVVKDGGRIYYCDTDSVVCSGVKLPVSTRLGGLELESNIVRAEFVLPKLYLIETTETAKKKRKEANVKIRAKGMGPGIRLGGNGDPDDLDGQLSEMDFFDLVRRGVPIKRNRLTKFRESLRSLHEKVTSFPRVVSAPKQLRTMYDKRRVLDDFDTAPINACELIDSPEQKQRKKQRTKQ